MDKDQVDFILEQWETEKPNLDTIGMSVIGRVSRASRHIDRHLQNNFAKFNLNRGEFDVLATLRRSGSPYQLTPTDLLQSLMLSSGAMTNRLDQLEKRGYIQRKSHPTDRRGVIVELTQDGYELIEEAVQAHIEYETHLVSSLNTNELDNLANLLRKLLLSLDDKKA
ncbi:MAG: MarR family transcriptional regulator [Chloroflexota bacterium]